MFYKNKYFALDTDTRAVSDENGKRVHITGNAYIMLKFLCERETATLTEIGDAIDPAAEYNENDIRQLRHKIKVALGVDVVLYKNHIYSIADDVTESETMEEQKEPGAITEKIKKVPNIPKNKKIIGIVLLVVAFIVLGVFLIQKNFTAIGIQKPKDDMVLIPAGEFLMGSTEAQALAGYALCQEDNHCIKDDYLAEYPAHKVSVQGFFIDKYEVSNTDYQLFVKATNHATSQYQNDSNLNQSNQPVVGVNWNDAQAYCEWLGKRLPTEAEWEKAARGTDGKIFPWGNTWGGAKSNHGTGGIPGTDASDGYEYTAPVGTTLGVSSFGVVNMAGNAAEWVADTFAPYTSNNKFTHSLYGQNQKVVRGGSYDQDKSTQRTMARYYFPPANADIDIGFRCAK